MRDLKAEHREADGYFQFARNTVKAMARNFPAPAKCVDCVEASVKRRFDEGLAFEREQFMTELGGGIYTTDEPPLPAPGTKIVQGAVEESNVQSVVEMTQMIEISRQYANNQKIIDAEHERQRNAITKLSRLS